MNLSKNAGWHSSPARNFWGEIAPSDHVVQIYDNDKVLLDTLAGFVGGGINEGDSIVVIATDSHLSALESKLGSFGIHIDALMSQGSYIPLNAHKTLETFMVNGLPDPQLFEKTISSVFNRARKNKRKVRAFGEMVAILWERGEFAATIQLEELWNRFMQRTDLSLFCAYPKEAFSGDPASSITGICQCHTKIISGTNNSIEHLQYKEVMAN